MSNHSNQQTRPALLKRKRQTSDEMSDEARNCEKNPKTDNDEFFSKDENEENDPSVFEKTKRRSNSPDEWNSGDDDFYESSESPEDEEAGVPVHQSWSKFRSWSAFLTPRTDRTHAMPKLDWADSQEVWDLMCKKDDINLTQRTVELFDRHSGLHPRMRSILLDWLIEVCEVYKLHRETYHMALDYIDRYLSIKRDIPKQQLQLIGITCLFIAAKIEEIYPPSLKEFAYVTDKACTEDEIIQKELVILKVLNWNLNSVTSNTWLNVYMQICATIDNSSAKQEAVRPRLCIRRGTPGWGSSKGDGPRSFHLPQYSALTFMQTAQLLDLCLLEKESMNFSYGTMAAAAMYLMYNREKALFVSGMQWCDLESCVRWMTPYAQILREEPCPSQIMAIANGQEGTGAPSKSSSDPATHDDEHTIQIHTVNLEILEKAQKLCKSLQESSSERTQPLEILDTSLNSPPSVYTGCLTPPSSHEKSSPKKSSTGLEDSESDGSALLNNSNCSTISAFST